MIALHLPAGAELRLSAVLGPLLLAELAAHDQRPRRAVRIVVPRRRGAR